MCDRYITSCKSQLGDTIHCLAPKGASFRHETFTKKRHTRASASERARSQLADMRLVIQRASEASVVVDGHVVGALPSGGGLVVLCGIHEQDTEADAEWACRKLLGVRLFESEDGSKPWVRSVAQAKLGLLLISQFTLFATLKGNKPDFHRAMGPTTAKPFWEAFVQRVRQAHSGSVAEGIFGAKMAVSLCNDGPVTIELESPSSQAALAPITPPTPITVGESTSEECVDGAAIAPSPADDKLSQQQRPTSSLAVGAAGRQRVALSIRIL